MTMMNWLLSFMTSAQNRDPTLLMSTVVDCFEKLEGMFYSEAQEWQLFTTSLTVECMSNMKNARSITFSIWYTEGWFKVRWSEVSRPLAKFLGITVRWMVFLNGSCFLTTRRPSFGDVDRVTQFMYLSTSVIFFLFALGDNPSCRHSFTFLRSGQTFCISSHDDREV